ncbi:Pvc16 family protein, partial [Burkholderia stagnalis]|uniref:Pvc16 family protein n=1 Tax=Burkholderia stagnalis TaxID=1503054 RepID=UPI000AC28A28
MAWDDVEDGVGDDWYEDDEEELSPSDKTLLKLNKNIKRALEKSLPHDTQIRFDLPHTPPTKGSVNVFLYDVHEDLQLRSAESRQYDPATGNLAPGFVHVQCCYLISYWHARENESADLDLAPTSESMKAMNRVLNALINHRAFNDLPGAYTRVIPPSEALNSLGSFW